jgi:hypothetical protein
MESRYIEAVTLSNTLDEIHMFAKLGRTMAADALVLQADLLTTVDRVWGSGDFLVLDLDMGTWARNHSVQRPSWCVKIWFSDKVNSFSYAVRMSTSTFAIVL